MFSRCVAFLFLARALSSSEAGPINKCCPFDRMMSTDEGCVIRDHDFKVPEGTVVNVVMLNCSIGMYPLDDGYDVSFPDGILSYDYPNGQVHTKDFCLDWSDEFNDTVPFICFTEPEQEYFHYYSIGLIVSMPFLLATALVYSLIERLRNFHGRCVVYHSSCMLLAYVGLVLMQNGVWYDLILCEIIGYGIQFFFLATFTWLNVLCWDIYWSFSGSRNVSGSVREREKKKLTAYSIYAWGTPLAILAITLVVDMSTSIPADSFFKPRVGDEKCFFSGDVGKWIYLYFPMGLLLICNSYIFVVTAYRVWSIRKEAEALNREQNPQRASRKDKERYSLYLKLFIVMGISWLFELLSSIIEGPKYFWIITDITNTLQGVFIFIILVLKKKVRTIVWEKICDCFGKKTSATTTHATKDTDSSHSTNSIEMSKQTISH